MNAKGLLGGFFQSSIFRFFLTVVLAALLIVVVYLVVSWFVDGYFGGNIFPDRAEPDTWSAPDSWSEWRDIAIVGMAVLASGLVFLAAILLVILILLALTVQRTVDNQVIPLLDTARELVDELRGTLAFIGESAVTPIIRAYSAVSGVRRGLGVITSLAGRFRSKS